MEEKYNTVITDIGLQKEVQSHKEEGIPLRFSFIAVGDGVEPEDVSLEDGVNEVIDEQKQKLKNELHRAEVNRVYIDQKKPKELIIEALIPEEVGGFYIREVGIFDQDNDLFAIARYPETYKPKLSEGTAKDLYIRMILAFSSMPNITLSVDNSQVMEGFLGTNNLPVGMIFAYPSISAPTGFLALNGQTIGNKDSGADNSDIKYKALHLFLQEQSEQALEMWNSGEIIVLPDLADKAIIGNWIIKY